MNLFSRNIDIGRIYEAYTQSLRDFSMWLHKELGLPSSAKLFITCGATGAIDAAFSIFSAGQTIAMMPYEYFDAICMSRMRGLNIVRTAVDDKSNSIEALLQNIDEHQPDLCYLSVPNNPSGSTYRKSDLKRIFLAMADKWVIVDQTLIDEKPVSIKWLISNAGNAHIIIIGSFSKTHGLVNERIGYLVSNTELATVHTYAHAPSKSSMDRVQHLKNSRYTKRVLKRIAKNNSIISHWANQNDSCIWRNSASNFGILHVKEPSSYLAEALRARGLSVKSEAELECEGNFLRLDLTVPPKTTREIIKIIDGI